MGPKGQLYDIILLLLYNYNIHNTLISLEELNSLVIIHENCTIERQLILSHLFLGIY